MSATEYNPCPKCGMPLLLTQPNKCSECGWPAATVHGTGSGEAIDELCPRCHDKKILHKSGGCMAMDCSCSLTFVPTPPASPTVTLDREKFDDLVMMLEKLAHSEQVINGMKVITHGLGARAIALDALTLLRAAEQKQPTDGTEAVLAQAKKESALLYNELTKLKVQVKDLLNHLSSSGT